jgi:hypothetical protein
MPGQNRKTATVLFYPQNLPHRFHPCLGFSSREHWEEDLKADLRSRRRACPGTNECSPFANVTSMALTLFFNPAVCPPKHNWCLQGEPDSLSGVSWLFHPLPRFEPLTHPLKFTANRMRATASSQEAQCPLFGRHLSGVIGRVYFPTRRRVQKSTRMAGMPGVSQCNSIPNGRGQMTPLSSDIPPLAHARSLA